MVEGPEHFGNVPKRGTFQAALTQWPVRFSFKIDENKIFARVKNLSKMQVAMRSNAQRLERSRIELLQE